MQTPGLESYSAPKHLSGLPARRILIVDDDRDIVDTQAVLFENLGQTVCRAYGGKSAVELAPHFGPDLILIDLDMPVMSGFKVAEELRKLPGMKGVRLVAHTAFGRPEYLAATESSLFDDYVRKPMTFSRLVRILLGDEA